MIEPNMATMLCFITTDANITKEMLSKALKASVGDSFNMVSVDGDTSTNDTVTVMASGLANNPLIDCENESFEKFTDALKMLCCEMAQKIAADGEGATKLIKCRVLNFDNVNGAKKLAKSVIRSSLVKAAMFGSDANWGRILCALGYSGVDFDPDLVEVYFIGKAGKLEVCKNGRGVEFDEDFAKILLSEDQINIVCDMHAGNENATAWGCDLTYDYVKINGDYRT
jgi:glutamate N-acetyltransferase/amino-acid N-acetyltransferase